VAYTGKNKPSGNMLSPSRILQLEKTAAALELRKRGKTFDEIADICGWANRNGAFLAIQRELSRRISEPAEGVLALEIERLDALLDGLWDSAIGTPAFTTEVATQLADGSIMPAGTLVAARPGDPKATAAVLKIMERRAKLLGLDKPEQKQVTTTIHEIPQAPPDMGDYHQKLLATLALARIGELPLPDGMEPLASPGLLIEGKFTNGGSDD
jgi:hypothetical protein